MLLQFEYFVKVVRSIFLFCFVVFIIIHTIIIVYHLSSSSSWYPTKITNEKSFYSINERKNSVFICYTRKKKPKRNTTTIRKLKTPRKKNIQLHLCDVYNVVGRSVVVFFFKKRKEKESSISFFLASTIIIIVFFSGIHPFSCTEKTKPLISLVCSHL